jgi:hypothetical protein
MVQASCQVWIRPRSARWGLLGPPRAQVRLRGAGATPAWAGGPRRSSWGQPNRLLHCLDHETFILSDVWQRWSDGWWRAPPG